MAVFITDRCIANKLNHDDIEDSIRLFTDDNVRKYLGGSILPWQAIEKLYQWILDDKSVYLGIRLKVNNEFIGIVSVSPYHNPDYQEISYQFLPEHWDNGYAIEIVKETLHYCKDTLLLKKIVSETQTENIKSCRLLERLDYQLVERIFRFGAEQSIYYCELL